MKKLLSIILTIIIIIIVCLSIHVYNNGKENSDGKIKVSVTFNAMKEFAEAVRKR